MRKNHTRSHLNDQEQEDLHNPVKNGTMVRLPDPLPKYLKDEEVEDLFKEIKSKRDRAIFILMLRCGLRVDEGANLTVRAVDLKRRQIFVFNGNSTVSSTILQIAMFS